MSIANTESQTIFEAGIIEPNDQTEARVEHLKQLESLVGNSYPNKYERSFIVYQFEIKREENREKNLPKLEDTISRICECREIKEIVKELKDATPTGEKPDQELKAKLNEKLKEFGNVRISGRLAVPPRVMGKAAFVHLSDGKNRLQIYVRRDDVRAVSSENQKPDEETSETNKLLTANGSPLTISGWEVFKLLDHGDFIGAEGYLFLTNTGELSVHVETFQFLAKALLPMPDKMHGIADPELRRRFRYADLIASSLQVEHEEGELTTREVFERRAKLISGMRNYLDAHGYIEVETPMLTPKATGAAAEPFETFHKALGIPLYARIAPELYLKRLTVGGFEKVYELNRNFRNEGLSHKHNPEFTMLEFYCAYMDVNGMMDFAEAMIQESVKKATGGLKINYDLTIRDYSESLEMGITAFTYKQISNELNFESVKRLSMKDAISQLIISEYDFIEYQKRKFSIDWLNDNSSISLIRNFARKIHHWGLPLKEFQTTEVIEKASYTIKKAWEETIKEFEERARTNEDFSLDIIKDKAIVEIFELIVEDKLIQPTFIIDYPKSISPLSKASPENPQIAERFELFINGMECANGFSELNDPQEQYERFVDQMKERESGDAEAMVLDEDYIRALTYGMPPAAGIGIGIDRLVMLLTNKHSIRDVILFPHMRPVTKEEEKKSEGEEKSEN